MKGARASQTRILNAVGIQYNNNNNNNITNTCKHHSQQLVVKYQGRSMNKLQNGVFSLILKISKILNIRFVGNLFLYLQKLL